MPTSPKRPGSPRRGAPASEQEAVARGDHDQDHRVDPDDLWRYEGQFAEPGVARNDEERGECEQHRPRTAEQTSKGVIEEGTNRQNGHEGEVEGEKSLEARGVSLSEADRESGDETGGPEQATPGVATAPSEPELENGQRQERLWLRLRNDQTADVQSGRTDDRQCEERERQGPQGQRHATHECECVKDGGRQRTPETAASTLPDSLKISRNP